MKKCPKCGTILDDSKKTCYMCGAELQKASAANFGDSFNSQIGATMSMGQDNVFSNGAGINGVSKGNENNSISVGSGKAHTNLFQNQLNGLNSLQYDERTKLEKIFDSEDKKKKDNKGKNKKEEIIKNTGTFHSGDGNAKQGMALPMQNQGVNGTSNLNNVFSSNDFKIPNQNQSRNESKSLPHINLEEKVGLNKPGINWGDNLGNVNNDFWKFRDKKEKKSRNDSGFSLNTLFNFICFLLCIGGIAFVYFKFVKAPKPDEIVSFGGLSYKIDEKFVLKTDDNHSRYYTYGDNCAVRINYGTTSNPEGFVENYFKQIKDTYSNQEGYTTSTQKLRINDNQWEELSVQGIKENAAAPNGYSFYSKYKHVAIVNKGNYYDIVYANTEDDSTCSGMYDTLIQSFTFE